MKGMFDKIGQDLRVEFNQVRQGLTTEADRFNESAKKLMNRHIVAPLRNNRNNDNNNNSEIGDENNPSQQSKNIFNLDGDDMMREKLRKHTEIFKRNFTETFLVEKKQTASATATSSPASEAEEEEEQEEEEGTPQSQSKQPQTMEEKLRSFNTEMSERIKKGTQSMQTELFKNRIGQMQFKGTTGLNVFGQKWHGMHHSSTQHKADASIAAEKNAGRSSSPVLLRQMKDVLNIRGGRKSKRNANNVESIDFLENDDSYVVDGEKATDKENDLL